MQMVALALESRDLVSAPEQPWRSQGRVRGACVPNEQCCCSGYGGDPRAKSEGELRGLQPFRFIALEDEASNSLQMALESLQDRLTAGRCLRRG